MVEVLLSLSITLMIVTSTTSILKIMKYKQIEANHDISIGCYHIGGYLLSSHIISYDSTLIYKSDKEYSISLDKNRVVKKPGFEILITNVDSIEFINHNDFLFINVKRNNKTFSFLIADLYKKVMLS